MKKKTNRIFGLDLIRALAILLILCSHSVVLIAPNSTEMIPFTIKFFGTIGVDVFFVLSGFLIGSILLKQIRAKKTAPKDFVYFWVRRWFRTLPNYYLILITNLILVGVFSRINDFSILNYTLFLQNFNTAQADFFTESWSLTIEEFAYIILPLALLIIGFITKKVTQRSFLITTILIIVLSIINRLYFHFYLAENLTEINWSKSLRKVLVYRIDSIYYGFIGAYMYLNFNVFWQKSKYITFIIGALIFAGLHVYIITNHLEPSVESFFFNNVYLTGLSLSILLLFPLIYAINSNRIFKSIITKISHWSYALYLVNYSVVLLTLKDLVVISELSIAMKGVLVVAFWMISFFFSILLYRFYEQPLLKLRDAPLVGKMFNKS